MKDLHYTFRIQYDVYIRKRNRHNRLKHGVYPTAVRFHAGLVSSDVVPVGGSGQDGGGGAGVGPRF